MKSKEIALTSAVLLLLVGSITALSLKRGRISPAQLESGSQPNEVAIEESAPAFEEGVWINSEPLTIKGLRGRVVLIEFWTFGCYNCRNTLPFVKTLHRTYSSKGLTIVGVHSPEFDNEKKLENVRREVAELGITYPILVDNDYA